MKYTIKQSTNRLETLDLVRGLTMISMIVYHGMWDFLYLSGTGAAMTGLRTWYEGPGGHLWQQSICRTFILLSGFCVPFSRRIFRRGLQVTGGGLAVSAVTLLWMYEDRVVFGVLTFLGAAMLLAGAVEKRLRKAASLRGIVLFLLLFHLTRWVNAGYLRFGPWFRLPLPRALYVSAELQGNLFWKAAGFVLTGLGFPMKNFFSTDYFSLFPWIFLFLAGTCLHHLSASRPYPGAEADGPGQREGGLFRHPLFHFSLPVLNWMGQHSLLIYLLHQPVLYLLVSAFF